MPGFGYGAFGGSAFGTLGDFPPDLQSGVGLSVGPSVWLTMRLSQAMQAAVDGSSQVWPSASSGLQAGDVPDAEVLANLIDRVHASGTVHASAQLAGDAASGVQFFDSIMAAWQLLLEEEIGTAGAAASNVRKLAALVDALAATGQAQSNLSAFAACVSALALEGLLAQGYSVEAADQVLMADTATAIAKLLGPLVDGVMATDDATMTLRISAITTDGVAVGDDPAAILRSNADLADGVLVYATLRLGGTDYVGWVLNTDLQAPSLHRNVAFDSFASFKGKHYGAGPSGLVQFTGTSEDGAPIEAYLRTALIDFGTSKFKKTPEIFIGVTDGGALVAKVITREPNTGRKVEDWYQVERLPVAGPGTGRAKPGKGLKSTYWQLVLHNVAGAAFALNKIEWRPVILDSRT